MIRDATLDDVDPMIDVATESRFAFQSWEPELWGSPAADAAALPVLLRSLLVGAGATVLVAEMGGRIVAWLRAAPSRPDGTWCVTDLAITSSGDQSGAGPALLVAAASRARAADAEGLVVPSPAADERRTSWLVGAGLHRVGSWGHRALRGSPAQPPAGVRSYVDADAHDAERLTVGRRGLPGCHGMGESVEPGEALVLDDGHGVDGVALLRRTGRRGLTLASSVPLTEVDPIALAHHVSWTDGGDRLLGGVEWLATRRGDRHVLIGCGADDVERHAALEARGYGWPVDLWSLDWSTSRAVIRAQPSG